MIRLLLISILILGLGNAKAQKQDAVLWTGLGAELPITKKFAVDFESQVRFSNNMSMFRQVYGELGGSYKVVKGLRGGLVYRYARKNDGDYYFNANRITLYTDYRFKTEFGLSIRAKLRYQHTFDRLSEVNGIYPDRSNLIRLGFKAAYKFADFKLLTPYIGTEFFHAVQPQNETAFLDAYRFKVGVNVDLPKRLSLKAFYIFEHENRSLDNRSHIYGIQLNYAFKTLIKKKKDESATPDGDAAP